MRSGGLLREVGEGVEETIVGALRELGFSSYASRTLMALLLNSPQSAGRICKTTGIPDSKIYYALEELNRAKVIESQRGTPSLFRPVQFDQLISNLIRSEEEQHERRLALIRNFRKLVEPLTRARAEPSDVELAYIVKGDRNITERMLTAIKESRKEIVLLISNLGLWEGLVSGLLEAKKRKVNVSIATKLSPTNARSMNTFADIRNLSCDCNIVIADSEKLVTAEHIETDDAYAIITTDKSMIRMSREFFENPNCCAQ